MQLKTITTFGSEMWPLSDGKTPKNNLNLFLAPRDRNTKRINKRIGITHSITNDKLAMQDLLLTFQSFTFAMILVFK